MANLKINENALCLKEHIHLHVFDGKHKIVYRECEGYKIDTSTMIYQARIKAFKITDNKKGEVHIATVDLTNFNLYKVSAEDEEFMKEIESGEDVVVYRKNKKRK